MIPFLAKTWFLWWALAVVLILRWLHVLSTRDSALDPLASELASEEELAYLRSWHLRQKAQRMSLLSGGASGAW